MAVFGYKPDDVIQKPEQERYKRREPKALPAQTDIQNFGLARLIDSAANYREQQGQNQYEDMLSETNTQRAGIAEVMAAAEAEMERRKQTLDYGKGLGDKIPQAPIMTAEGIPGGGEAGAFDATNLAQRKADVNKTNAEAAKAGNEGKSPIEFRQDEFGKQVMIIKDPIKVLNDPMYREMLSPEQIKRMQGGGTSAVNNVADRAAAAGKPVSPTGGVLKNGTKYTVQNAEQQQDGSFIADVVAGGKPKGKFRVDTSGAIIGRAE